MNKKVTTSDKIFWFLLRKLFPKYMREIVELKLMYLKSRENFLEMQQQAVTVGDIQKACESKEIEILGIGRRGGLVR